MSEPVISKAVEAEAEPLLATSQVPSVAKGGMSKGLKIGLGIAAGLILLTLLGLTVWYFGFRKTDSCTNSSDCKDSNKPNCVAKKCVATDDCSPACVTSSDKPYCVSNTCVSCRTVDDCKSRTDGKTICSGQVCVAPMPSDNWTFVGCYFNLPAQTDREENNWYKNYTSIQDVFHQVYSGTDLNGKPATKKWGVAIIRMNLTNSGLWWVIPLGAAPNSENPGTTACKTNADDGLPVGCSIDNKEASALCTPRNWAIYQRK